MKHFATYSEIKKVILFSAAMSFYLNRKAALTEPELLSLAFKFQIASAAWMCRVATVKLPKAADVNAKSKVGS